MAICSTEFERHHDKMSKCVQIAVGLPSMAHDDNAKSMVCWNELRLRGESIANDENQQYMNTHDAGLYLD